MDKRWAKVVLCGALGALGAAMTAQAAQTPVAVAPADKVERVTVLFFHAEDGIRDRSL